MDKKTEKAYAMNIHAILDENVKVSPIKTAYWDILFKLTGQTSLWSLLPYRWRDVYWSYIRPIFAPHHKRLRKVIPKTWCDITHLIEVVNFEFIKSFYEDEFSKGYVNWDATEHHQKFKKWLISAYEYITVERLELQNQRDNAYPEYDWTNNFEEVDGKRVWKIDDAKSQYEKLYGEVDRLERLISKKDSKILTDLVKYRDYFWT